MDVYLIGSRAARLALRCHRKDRANGCCLRVAEELTDVVVDNRFTLEGGVGFAGWFGGVTAVVRRSKSAAARMAGGVRGGLWTAVLEGCRIRRSRAFRSYSSIG